MGGHMRGNGMSKTAVGISFVVETLFQNFIVSMLLLLYKLLIQEDI